ncbi:hypothetical protein STRTUCAR8_08345 [Streptomyces turgidiscabies Car8]|uniref:Uncharacterized protein n=1 Tax=Streptomyces turgidiscabies (strain Car8) TaxID=698760 RepID=L7F0W0_STRT8|nr:hypothetical protein STRTUCAR8_08345 [Streptomyces turgidiscabies Car8]
MALRHMNRGYLTPYAQSRRSVIRRPRPPPQASSPVPRSA